MKERIVVVFIAIAIGLLTTTLIFFLYQQTKTIPDKTRTLTRDVLTPTPSDLPYLTIDEPRDESLVDRRTIQIKGKTNRENSIIVSTNQEDIVSNPTADGNFAVTVTIDAGSNKIITRVISPSGEEASDTRVITYSTEEF